MKLSDFDLGLVIGMLEGEGHIGLHRHQHKRCKRPGLFCTVEIANTNSERLYYLANVLDGGFTVTAHKLSCRANRKTIYMLRAAKQEVVYDFLHTVKPFLISSELQHRCDLVLEWINIRWNLPPNIEVNKYCHTDREWEIFYELRSPNKDKMNLHEK